VLPPERGTCSVAFKEWAGVCDALARGRQSLILRKGGIREGQGPGAFVPEHDEFWLYPTAVHQSQQGLRFTGEGDAPGAGGPGSLVPIGLLARVDLIGQVCDEGRLPALEEFHILTAETVRSRFHYRTPGLWVLIPRIWRREPPFHITPTVEQAGCKTWVKLDTALPTSLLQPAVDDSEWATRLARLRAIFEEENTPTVATRAIGKRLPDQQALASPGRCPPHETESRSTHDPAMADP
jgi:hypothetical protein